MHFQHFLNMENDGGNCWFQESWSVLNYRLTYNDIICCYCLILDFFLFSTVGFAACYSGGQGLLSNKPFFNQLKKTLPSHGFGGILLYLCVCCRMLWKALCNISKRHNTKDIFSLTYNPVPWQHLSILPRLLKSILGN